MSVNSSRGSGHGSAEIYDFPQRPRVGRMVYHDEAAPVVEIRAIPEMRTGAEFKSPVICAAALESCWYHEAAIQQSQIVTKH